MEQLCDKLSAPVARPKVDYGVPNNHDDYEDLLKSVLRDTSPISEESIPRKYKKDSAKPVVSLSPSKNCSTLASVRS